MPLQIRRGSTAQRLTITPLPGELIYDTTTGQLYVGDGATVGGSTTTGISLEDARDAAAGLLTSGVHSGITFTYNDALDRIDATVTIGGTGPFDGDISGSVFADNSTLLVDGTGARIVGPLASTGSTHTIAHSVAADETGLTITGTDLSYTQVTSRLKIVVNGVSSSTDHGLSIDSFGNGAVGPRLTLYKSRGSLAAPDVAAQVNDSIGDIWFLSSDGTQTATGLRFGGQVTGVPTAFAIPAKFRWQTNISGSFTTKMELSDVGTLSVNAIQNLSGTDLSLTGTNLQLNGTTILNNRAELRFEDTDGSNYVSLRSPAVVASNLTFNLPSTGGNSLDVLYTDGAGNLILGPLSNVFPGKVGAQIAIGTNAGQTSQGTNGIALGFQAGQTSQGNYAIAIGYNAGLTSQHNNSVIINGGSTTLNSTGGGTYINPVRIAAPTGNLMYYNTSTKEIIYSTALLISLVQANQIAGDLTGSVFASDSTRLVDALESALSGRIVTATNHFQLPVYADDTARLASIPTPAKGMMIMMEAGTTPAATNNVQVYDGTNWVNL